MKIQKAIVFGDSQAPFTNSKTIMVLEKYLKSQKWDYLIYLGDMLDYFCISRFNEGKPGMLEGKSILAELKEGKTMIERQIRLVRENNPHCKVIYLEGNHETRAYDFVNRFPHLKGIIEPENILEFKKNNIEYYRSWSKNENFKKGKLTFMHGRYLNQYHARKTVDNFDSNVIYGDTHTVQSFTKVSFKDQHPKMAQALGCTCEYPANVDYTKGSPKAWVQALCTVYFQENGNFNHYVSIINNGEFVAPDGKFYSYK